MSERNRVIEGITGLLVDFLREEGIEAGKAEQEVKDLLYSAGSVALGHRWSEQAEEEPEEIECVCGRRLPRRQVRVKRFLSLLGWTKVKRPYYWCPQCRQGYYPFDQCLGSRGRAQTGVVQECVALTVAEAPYGAGQHLLRTLAGLEIPHHTLEEIATQLGQALMVERDDGNLPETEEVPETLCISTDGVKVPMRDGWREARVVVSYACDVTPGGIEPEARDICYSARVEDCQATGQRMADEAIRRGVDKVCRGVSIGDGADWIWNQVGDHFPQAIQIVDWYHAVEHLWEVANTVFGQGTNDAATWAALREGELWQGDVESVLQAMRDLFYLRRRTDSTFRNSEAEHVLQTNMSYFSTHRKRMDYACFRQEKLPIASGVVESACKHFVAQRCKRSGMQWKQTGLHAVLELRAALLSNQWHNVQTLFKDKAA